MQKGIKAILIMLFILVASGSQAAQANSDTPLPAFSTATELINAVNALRSTYGLAAYQPNSILMSVAQSHAEYLLSIGTLTHTSANGLRPYQRALNSGYLVAGDLSLGGWYSENITGGVGQTAGEAVQNWMGDDPHKNTMLSGTLRDVGAGVAVNGNTYYCLLYTSPSPRDRSVSRMPSSA